MVFLFIMVPEGKDKDKLVLVVCSKGVYSGFWFFFNHDTVSLRRKVSDVLCVVLQSSVSLPVLLFLQKSFEAVPGQFVGLVYMDDLLFL